MKNLFHFHKGRGGLFNQAGFIQFSGLVESIINIGDAFNSLIPPASNYPDSQYITETGEKTGLTVADVKKGTGTIDIDEDYDTDIVVARDDLDSSQVGAIIDSHWYQGNHDTEEALYIILKNDARFEKYSERDLKNMIRCGLDNKDSADSLGYIILQAHNDWRDYLLKIDNFNRHDDYRETFHLGLEEFKI